jgi:hypothetical protein
MAKTNAQRARDAAQTVSENPYLRRLMEDEDLRDNLREAYDSLRDAGARLSNGKGPAKALMDDKKVHKDLRTAAESLRDASDQLRGKRERHPFRKLLLIGIVGAVAALVLSEDLRKALLDRLFGAEEEFEYASTTSATPAAAGSGNGSG